jgi:hypothetical protein
MVMTTDNDERRHDHMTCLRLLHCSFQFSGPLQKLHGGVSPPISKAPLYLPFKSTKIHELAGGDLHIHGVGYSKVLWSSGVWERLHNWKLEYLEWSSLI